MYLSYPLLLVVLAEKWVKAILVKCLSLFQGQWKKRFIFMSTSGNQGGICAAALCMRGTAAAGSLSASGRGGAQDCSPCWLRTEWCVLFTERPLITPEFVIHYILYTTSTCGLLFCCFLRWYQVCSAHKTSESTTTYYISENVSAKQCNCHLEITKKKVSFRNKDECNIPKLSLCLFIFKLHLNSQSCCCRAQWKYSNGMMGNTRIGKNKVNNIPHVMWW